MKDIWARVFHEAIYNVDSDGAFEFCHLTRFPLGGGGSLSTMICFRVQFRFLFLNTCTI
jgi:hypothetical protein